MSVNLERLTALNATWRWALLALIAGLYLGVGVFDHEIWPPGEEAVAGATWSMLRDGDVVVPRIDGMPYLEKPPLTYALSASICKVAGHTSAGLVRLPSALFGLLSLALVFATIRRKYGETVAWTCTLVCATTYSFYEITHRACTDSTAMFFAFLCFALFVRSLEDADEPGGGTRGVRDDLLFCVALATSFYAKNFYTFLIVLPPVAIFLVVTRQLRRLFSIGAMTLAALAILLVPWCLALYARGGSDYLRVVFVDNTIGRYLTLPPILAPAPERLSRLNDAYRVHRDGSPLSFLLELGMITLPWVLIQGGALVHLFAAKRPGHYMLFLKIAIVTIPAALSLSSSKVFEYLLPILFLFALATADFLSSTMTEVARPRRWMAFLVASNVLLVILGLAVAPFVASWLLHDRPLLVCGVATAAIAAWIVYLFRARLRESAFVLATTIFVAGFATLTLSFAIPRIDQTKSWRPFFDQIAPDVADRELYTSYCDDRRLPAMNYYLDRSVKTLAAPEDAFALLAGNQRVAIILSVDFYEAQKARFASIPHTAVRASCGRDLFVLVRNP